MQILLVFYAYRSVRSAISHRMALAFRTVLDCYMLILSSNNALQSALLTTMLTIQQENVGKIASLNTNFSWTKLVCLHAQQLPTFLLTFTWILLHSAV